MDIIHIHDKIVLLKTQIEVIDKKIIDYQMVQKTLNKESSQQKFYEIEEFINQLKDNKKLFIEEYDNLEKEYTKISKKEDILYKKIYETLNKISKNRKNEVYDFYGNKVDY